MRYRRADAAGDTQGRVLAAAGKGEHIRASRHKPSVSAASGSIGVWSEE